MKRNKITSSEFIDDIEFTSDLTKLPNDDQYLKHTAFNAIKTRDISISHNVMSLMTVLIKLYVVIVNVF